MKKSRYILQCLILLVGLYGSTSAYALEDVFYCGEYEHTYDNVATGSIVATYLGGCEWQLEAIPAHGARFEKWLDNDDTNPIRTITVTPGADDFSYTASFVYVFAHCSTAFDYDSIGSATYGDAGTLSVTREIQDNGARLYKLQAIPNDGYMFAEWNDGVVENPRYIPNDVDELTIAATFMRPTNAFDIESWEGNGFTFVTESEALNGLKDVMIYKDNAIITTRRPIDSVVDTLGIYHVDFDNLADHAGDTCALIVYAYDGCPESLTLLRVPRVISSNTTIYQARTDSLDLHVLGGTVLRLKGGTNNSQYGKIMIYPGARMFVDDANIYADSVIMRADGLRASYPQLITSNGSVINTSGDVVYEYMLDFQQYYPFSVPAPVTIADVTYRDLTSKTPENEFVIHYYSGYDRSRGFIGWESYYDKEYGHTSYPVIEPCVGYDIFGAPLTWNSYGFRDYGIFRFPMTGVATIENETVQQLPVAPVGDPATVANKDRNWNSIGLPYFSSYKGEIWMLDNDDNPIGTLNYITYSDDFFRSYKTEETETMTLLPFNTYLIQVADTAYMIQFGAPSSAASAPKRRVQQAAFVRDLVAGITVAQGEKMDHTGLRLGQRYTPAYDINGDMGKQFGPNQGFSVFSVSPSNSQKLAYIALPLDESGETLIPLGYSSAQKGGEMTFAFDTARYADRLSAEIEALYLIDRNAATEVNLLEEDYTCVVSEAANNSRFALNVVYRAPQQQEEYNTATGICDMPRATSMPDGLYDLLGRRIHDTSALPAGAYIRIANGEARKEVIR